MASGLLASKSSHSFSSQPEKTLVDVGLSFDGKKVFFIFNRLCFIYQLLSTNSPAHTIILFISLSGSSLILREEPCLVFYP